MQIRVASEQVRLGMYITGVDCGWMRSPFWRPRFLLSDPEDLVTLAESDITFVTIDLVKGIGPADPVAETVIPAEPGTAPLLVERRTARRPASAPRGETERARETVQRSKAAVMQMFGEARLGRAIEIESVAPLVEEIAASMLRDRSAMLNVTRLKTKDEYTYMHSVAVCALMMNLARQLGREENEVRQLGLAGLLHDIGKMGVPEGVLGKPGRLDDDEFAIIRGHPQKGYAMLTGSPEISEIALDVCLHHHERIDGTGYPFGLNAEQLSLHARMGAICDVYDAVTSERPYKRPWSANEALGRMLEWEGHFDPELLQAFIRSIGIQPRDGLVRVHSNRLGLVVADGDDPNTPQVRVFYDVAEDRFVPPADIDTRNMPGCDPIISGERWPHWFGDGWLAVRAAVRAGETLSEHAARSVQGGGRA